MRRLYIAPSVFYTKSFPCLCEDASLQLQVNKAKSVLNKQSNSQHAREAVYYTSLCNSKGGRSSVEPAAEPKAVEQYPVQGTPPAYHPLQKKYLVASAEIYTATCCYCYCICKLGYNMSRVPFRNVGLDNVNDPQLREIRSRASVKARGKLVPQRSPLLI